MAVNSAAIPKVNRSLSRITCPHCWEVFPPEKILWVAEHADLLGEPMLGDEEMQRFLPTRFTVEGDAIDARGFPCHVLACPHCHLTVPRPMIELEPFFMSIFGAPASGKSYFLAAMTWQLRQTLSSMFACSFNDADPGMNQLLNEYEESLFLNPKANDLIPLASLIRKTEEQGDLYDSVSYGNQVVSYPRPFLFAMQPEKGHLNEAQVDKIGRVVCLYDNAGESFQPGKDKVGSPLTRHMAHSRTLMYVFDPTQDARFRKSMDSLSDDVDENTSSEKLSRQEPILQEAASRIRRYAKLRQTEKHRRPLIVVLTKYDAWSHLLAPLVGDDDNSEPFKVVQDKSGRKIHALDIPRILKYSKSTRKILMNICPDIVAAAENFSEDVIFMPVSSVGWCAKKDRENGMLAMRPAEANPFWVTVPFLYSLHRCIPGLIPGLKAKEGAN